METAKILRKSVLNPGKNWITLLNSANLSKKNAVTPVNFHLYHYASNNPVRYTDPDGRDTNLPFAFDKSYMLDNIPSECVKAIYDQEYKTLYNNSLYRSDKISVDVYKGSYFASFVLDLELDIQKQDNEDVGKKIKVGVNIVWKAGRNIIPNEIARYAGNKAVMVINYALGLKGAERERAKKQILDFWNQITGYVPRNDDDKRYTVHVAVFRMRDRESKKQYYSLKAVIKDNQTGETIIKTGVIEN